MVVWSERRQAGYKGERKKERKVVWLDSPRRRASWARFPSQMGGVKTALIKIAANKLLRPGRDLESR